MRKVQENVTRCQPAIENASLMHTVKGSEGSCLDKCQEEDIDEVQQDFIIAEFCAP